MTRTFYIAYGPVRGSCGHLHRTEEAAERCADADQRACRSQGRTSYSDRYVMPVSR